MKNLTIRPNSTTRYSLSLIVVFFSLFYTTNAFTQSYCPAQGTFPWEQWNERVSIANRVGSSIYPTTGKEGYGDFTQFSPAKMLLGEANLLTISPNSSWNNDPRNGNMFWRAWIDLNGDGDFSDVGEQVVSRQVVHLGVFLDNEQAFILPATARLGNTRLRIAMKVGDYPTACETFERGEVEDYTVQIVQGLVPPIKDTLRLVMVTGDASARQGGQVRLNITLRNSGNAASDPNTPLSIFQQQQPFAFKGPQPFCFEKVSNSVSIGRNIQPNETVTLPYVFTMADDFTNISPLEVPPVAFGETNVTIGNRGTNYCSYIFLTGGVLDTLAYRFNINALLNSADLMAEVITTDTTYSPDGTLNFRVKITNKSAFRIKDVRTNITASPAIFDKNNITPQEGIVNSYFFFGTYSNIWFVDDMAAGETLNAWVSVVKNPNLAAFSSLGVTGNAVSNQINDANLENNRVNKTFTRRSDACNNDTEAPRFVNCPKDTTVVILPNQPYYELSWSNPTATDNCGTPSVFSSPSTPYLRIGEGQTVTVIFTARDAKGNTTTCNWRVTAIRETSGKPDLALSIGATPSVFQPFSSVNFVISAQSIGNQAFTNVKIEFKFPQGTVTGGSATPSIGKWEEWCQAGIQCFTWTIPNLNKAQTATLTVPLFILNVNMPILATTKLLSSSPIDANNSNNQASITLMPAPAVQALSKPAPTQGRPIVISSIAPTMSDAEVVLSIESLVEKEVSFELHNTSGGMVQFEKRRLLEGSNKVYFDISTLPQGIYIVKPSFSMGRQSALRFIKM